VNVTVVVAESLFPATMSVEITSSNESESFTGSDEAIELNKPVLITTDIQKPQSNGEDGVKGCDADQHIKPVLINIATDIREPNTDEEENQNDQEDKGSHGKNYDNRGSSLQDEQSYNSSPRQKTEKPDPYAAMLDRYIDAEDDEDSEGVVIRNPMLSEWLVRNDEDVQTELIPPSETPRAKEPSEEKISPWNKFQKGIMNLMNPRGGVFTMGSTIGTKKKTTDSSDPLRFMDHDYSSLYDQADDESLPCNNKC